VQAIFMRLAFYSCSFSELEPSVLISWGH